MIQLSTYNSPIGILTLVARDGALVGLWIEGQKYFGAGFDLTSVDAGETETAEMKVDPESTSSSPSDEFQGAILARTRKWLDSYFCGCKPSLIGLSLAPQGTAFQREVWSLLLEIPYGQLRSYGELAIQLGTSPRAVGSAVRYNPISIIIPCHRVVSADGRLTGYAGGLERKRWLLIHEAAIEPKF